MSLTLWKDPEKKFVDPCLFSKDAEEMAKKFASKGEKRNKSSQLRRFFDEVVRLNDIAKTGTRDMALVLPFLHLVIAKAAYARGRGLVCDDFVELIRDGIGQIKTKDDLQVFTSFFEAIMAFYKLYRPS